MSSNPSGGRIDPTRPRTLFGDLVRRAARQACPRPSAGALEYLVDLLTERVRIPPPADRDRGDPTLAEGLLEARLLAGALRIRRLRAVGDRALFVAGFFGDSLARKLVDLDYFQEIGRSAYGDLSSTFSHDPAASSWQLLFAELSQRFSDLTDVLAEVGDRSRRMGPSDLLRLYERYLRTGSRRDLERLMRIGGVAPTLAPGLRWQ
jgi:hypothetical protein